MAAATGIFAARSTWLDAWIQLGVASGRVISLTVRDSEPDDHQGQHPALDRVVAYLDDAERDSLADITIGLTGPTSHRAIYETVRTIPYGTAWELEQIVSRTPAEIDTSEGRHAITDTPIPIIIPVHRVLVDPGPTAQCITDALRERESIVPA